MRLPEEVRRKLKLQMQVTVDGYVAGPEGQLDWMTFDMDAVFSKTLQHVEGENVRVENGDLVEAVKQLRAESREGIAAMCGVQG
jgi:hypothetical protein